MLSRKQFFKDLLFRGIQAVDDLSVTDKGRSSEREEFSSLAAYLPATELSPSLLAIEAELRGVSLQAGDADELQREIYAKLAQNRPSTGGEESQ